MSGEQFSLVWNSFPTNLSSGLYSLLADEHLVDVTLTAEGQILRAHKLILSVCSSYFRELFKGNTCKHPIVILKDVNYRDLSAMLHFMYQGEVSIKQEDISSFLKLAETLQIKGLTKENHTNATQDHLEDEIIRNTLKTESIEVDSQPINDETHEFDRSIECPLGIDTSAKKLDENLIKVTSSNYLHRSNENYENDTTMRSLNSMINENYEDQNFLPHGDDQPLDCTANETRDNSNDTKESSNYRFTGNNGFQDFSLTNCQQNSYGQDCQKESLEVNSSLTNSRDYNCEGSTYAKGKRTVRGLPGTSLPLETTLRVVSEIGPTLRVDRGKVVRMYSCPWCLRHFTRKENLKLHVRYIHGPLESLTCKLCGNKYKNSNSLRVHSYLYHNTKRNKHTKPPLVGGNI